MLGSVESIEYDGERVHSVCLRFPSREHASGSVTREVRMCERIGQGSFGTVYRALCDGYARLAVKISTGKPARLQQELDVLSRACTKGKLVLPRFEFGALNQSGDLIVIGMELCVPCTLHDLLLHTRLTDEADMLFLAYQAVQAVACVHSENCIHRDIKLQNFVFDLDGNLKLIDFGLSCNSLQPPPGDVVAGTVSFMSPEMAHNALYRDRRVSVGEAADMWSLGIVLFSIFTQRNPYPVTGSSPARPDTEPHTSRAASSSSSGSSSSSFSSSLSTRRRRGHPKRPRHESHDSHRPLPLPHDKEPYAVPTRSTSPPFPCRTAVPEGAAATEDMAVQRARHAQLLRRVAAGQWQWPSDCHLSESLVALVTDLLTVDPTRRPRVNDVLHRPALWTRRRRCAPTAVTMFLGLQEDLWASLDEAPLLRAVEQRSAAAAAAAAGSRHASRLASPTGSLLVVTEAAEATAALPLPPPKTHASRSRNESVAGGTEKGGRVRVRPHTRPGYLSDKAEDEKEEEDEAEKGAAGGRSCAMEHPVEGQVDSHGSRATAAVTVVVSHTQTQPDATARRSHRTIPSPSTTAVQDTAAMQVYDIRPAPGKRSVPLREIGPAIAAESLRQRSRHRSRSSHVTRRRQQTARDKEKEEQEEDERKEEDEEGKEGSLDVAAHVPLNTRNERALPQRGADASLPSSDSPHSSGSVSAAATHNDSDKRTEAVPTVKNDDFLCLLADEPTPPACDLARVTEEQEQDEERIAHRGGCTRSAAEQPRVATVRVRAAGEEGHTPQEGWLSSSPARGGACRLVDPLAETPSDTERAFLAATPLRPGGETEETAAEAAMCATDSSHMAHMTTEPMMNGGGCTGVTAPIMTITTRMMMMMDTTPSERGSLLHTAGRVNEEHEEEERMAESVVQTLCAGRARHEGLMEAEHEWLLDSFRLILEEDQERYHLTWLAEEQAKSASHAHRFKEMFHCRAKSYRYGIVCDVCDYEFLPHGRGQTRLHYFHCPCGRDICPECFALYQRQCTCELCHEIFDNSVALRHHHCDPEARLTAPAAPRRAATKRSSSTRKSTTQPSKENVHDTKQTAVSSLTHTKKSKNIKHEEEEEVVEKKEKRGCGRPRGGSDRVVARLAREPAEERVSGFVAAPPSFTASPSSSSTLRDEAAGILLRAKSKVSVAAMHQHVRTVPPPPHVPTARALDEAAPFHLASAPPPVTIPEKFDKPIDTLPPGPWRPFDTKSTRKTRRKATRTGEAERGREGGGAMAEECDTASAVGAGRRELCLPTQEERDAMLSGDWIRHFYLYPSASTDSSVKKPRAASTTTAATPAASSSSSSSTSSSRGAGATAEEEDEEEPYAFVYHIQPGRTGAVFLSADYPLHSAVFSMLERQFLAVDRVDLETGTDVTRATTLLRAKSHVEMCAAFATLQEIVGYDTNMLKQHRVPGTVSVYQAPRGAYTASGLPFLYVRWFRFSEDRTMTACMLSNGAVQVFVKNECELRWFDENRKFVVRCNGVCEVVEGDDYALAPAVNHLLYDDF